MVYFVLFILLWLLNTKSSIIRPSGKSKSATRAEREAATFDEFGALTHMESVYAAIQRAHPIVVFRNEDARVTVVGYYRSKKLQLIMPYGSEPMNNLVAPWQKLLLTGVASDCRVVASFAKEVALNHTFAYDQPPSAMYVATKIGSLLEDAARSGTRPYACALFLIDSMEKRIIRIDSSGEIASVSGGVAGEGDSMGETLLLREIENTIAERSNLKREKNDNETGPLTIEFARRVMKTMLWKKDILEHDSVSTKDTHKENDTETNTKDERDDRDDHENAYIKYNDEDELAIQTLILPDM